jgi:hypothetical protein
MHASKRRRMHRDTVRVTCAERRYGARCWLSSPLTSMGGPISFATGLSKERALARGSRVGAAGGSPTTAKISRCQRAGVAGNFAAARRALCPRNAHRRRNDLPATALPPRHGRRYGTTRARDRHIYELYARRHGQVHPSELPLVVSRPRAVLRFSFAVFRLVRFVTKIRRIPTAECFGKLRTLTTTVLSKTHLCIR